MKQFPINIFLPAAGLGERYGHCRGQRARQIAVVGEPRLACPRGAAVGRGCECRGGEPDTCGPRYEGSWPARGGRARDGFPRSGSMQIFLIQYI